MYVGGAARPRARVRRPVLAALGDFDPKQRKRHVRRKVRVRGSDFVKKLLLDRHLTDRSPGVARLRDDAVAVGVDLDDREADPRASGVCSQSVAMPPVTCVPHSIKCPATVAPASGDPDVPLQSEPLCLDCPTVKLGSATRPVITKSAPWASTAAMGRRPK